MIRKLGRLFILAAVALLSPAAEAGLPCPKGEAIHTSADSLAPLLMSSNEFFSPDVFHILTKWSYCEDDGAVNEFKRHKQTAQRNTVLQQYSEAVSDNPVVLLTFSRDMGRWLGEYDFEKSSFPLTIERGGLYESISLASIGGNLEKEFARLGYDKLDVKLGSAFISAKLTKEERLEFPISVEEGEALREAIEDRSYRVGVICRLSLSDSPYTVSFLPKKRTPEYRRLCLVVGETLASSRYLEAQQRYKSVPNAIPTHRYEVPFGIDVVAEVVGWFAKGPISGRGRNTVLWSTDSSICPKELQQGVWRAFGKITEPKESTGDLVSRSEAVAEQEVLPVPENLRVKASRMSVRGQDTFIVACPIEFYWKNCLKRKIGFGFEFHLRYEDEPWSVDVVSRGERDETRKGIQCMIPNFGYKYGTYSWKVRTRQKLDSGEIQYGEFSDVKRFTTVRRLAE